MEFVFTLTLFAICMAAMAIGLLFNRKPLAKDCGLDPISGERVTDCACAAQGKPQCLKRKVLNLFSNDEIPDDKESNPIEDAKDVVVIPKKTP